MTDDEADWKMAGQLAAESLFAAQDIEAVAAIIATARATERAAVVAWLLKRVENSYAVGTVPGTNGYEARMILEAIERGEHRREEER